MKWHQSIEYLDAQVVLPAPVKKRIWDEKTKTFVPMTLHKHQETPSTEQIDWLIGTYGYPGIYKDGCYWEYSRAGNFTIMDQKVYTWFQIKWGNK